ncbi:mechanosensitive ion channel family protein [Gracilimonas amylolytica]|uniref:mechanosensitive ion channel family protein n=1 Tax=Gracilimonas amylolytica TaxID=1749045 RepID=UPI000CD9854C|nr:mechanosensitive ion channel family protein [Gracilimonas amylolytica]
MTSFREKFETQIQQIIESFPQILGAVVAIIIFFFLGRLVSNGIHQILGKRKSTATKQTRQIRRIIRWGFNLIGFYIALNILGLTQVAMSFLAAGGVVAVVLGFAFREIGENLLAGFFLSFSRSFDVGDLIESNGLRGIVKRIEIRDVHIRTADGCDIYIPSATIYKNPLHNFTRDGLRRTDFTIGIDYGDDLGEAIQLLHNTLRNNPLVLDDPAPAIQISNFTPTYVELQIYFWVNLFDTDLDLYEVRSRIMDASHQSLSDKKYTFSSNVTTAIDMLPVQVQIGDKKDQNSDSTS